MFNQLNTNIFNFINHFAGQNNFLDSIIIFLAEYSPYVFILVLLVFWFQSEKKKKNITLFATYSATLGIVINYIIGLFYFHPRPFADGLGVNLVQHAPDSSFPSDHSTFMLSIALFLLYAKINKKLKYVLLTLAFLGAVSRVYTGVHYPFDILASLLVALISSFFIFKLREKLQKVNNFFINIYTWVVDKVFSVKEVK